MTNDHKRQLNLELWFPTPVYWIDVPDYETLNKDLEPNILDLSLIHISEPTRPY